MVRPRTLGLALRFAPELVFVGSVAMRTTGLQVLGWDSAKHARANDQLLVMNCFFHGGTLQFMVKFTMLSDWG